MNNERKITEALNTMNEAEQGNLCRFLEAMVATKAKGNEDLRAKLTGMDYKTITLEQCDAVISSVLEEAAKRRAEEC